MVDNIVFITILADKLPKVQRKKARQVGLILAMLMRIILLLSLTWLIGLTAPLFTIFNVGISGRDLILLIGGLFLLGKSTYEIHDKLEGEEGHSSAKVRGKFINVVVQIMLLDIVFSLDSVITAVGMANEIAVMITAVIIAVIIMMLSVNVISKFISDHPTIKILALSFLLLIFGYNSFNSSFGVFSSWPFDSFAIHFHVFKYSKSSKGLRERYS